MYFGKKKKGLYQTCQCIGNLVLCIQHCLEDSTTKKAAVQSCSTTCLSASRIRILLFIESHSTLDAVHSHAKVIGIKSHLIFKRLQQRP